VLTDLIKRGFRYAGFKIERRDPLEETIPADYNHSPFLPRVYRGSLDRYLYFLDQLKTIRDIDGDIVECGVSIGHGALLFLLFSEYLGVERTYYGFDSFAGFPDPVEKDEVTPITGRDFWASPPETVLRVLRYGRIPEDKIRNYVRLIKGRFDETLPKYRGRIALLHLDCDLYESYKVSLATLYDKVVPGGIIMFDEYDDKRWPGAKKAIDEFFADKREKPTPHQKCDWKYYVEKA
jgi:predicted O-methyltransferase YrrM